jgi:hypothetical protein
VLKLLDIKTKIYFAGYLVGWFGLVWFGLVGWLVGWFGWLVW